MNLLQYLRQRQPASDGFRSWDQLWASFTYGGVPYPVELSQTLGGGSGFGEETGSDFTSLVHNAYKADGPVFAVMLARMMLFSQARFQWQRMNAGRPGDLFGSPELGVLETPWTNGTTSNLLARTIQDADLAGNFYGVRPPDPLGRPTDRIRRLRPDWTTIILGGDYPHDPNADIVGYIYQPGGITSGQEKVEYLAAQVAHFAPIPDPEATYRGMSWLTPVIREVAADKAATAHKLKFFENGATPNMVVKLDVPTVEKFREWVKEFREGHEGVAKAYKTLFLGGGADATVVGANLRQLAFKDTQGAGETRIAAAGGVPPVIVGLSEGLQAATYSNYAQARRRFADGTAWPLWGAAAGAFESIVTPPAGARLWIDARGIPFLREDRKDAAEIQHTQASSIKQLTDAGFKPDSVIKAVLAEDMTLLQHSGLYSVQLQKPGSNTPAQPAA